MNENCTSSKQQRKTIEKAVASKSRIVITKIFTNFCFLDTSAQVLLPLKHIHTACKTLAQSKTTFEQEEKWVKISSLFFIYFHYSLFCRLILSFVKIFSFLSLMFICTANGENIKLKLHIFKLYAFEWIAWRDFFSTSVQLAYVYAILSSFTERY